MDGIILVDKPQGWTSHDVVGKMRRIANTRKIGHLGTLDPMATGVLPLVINRATRLSQFYLKAEKIYEAVVRFGFSTDTYDAEGEPTSPSVPVNLTAEQVEAHLEAFRGEIQQVPPPVSAKKINGVPAYKLARKQQPVELKPVPVTIHELTLLRCEGDRAWIRVHCSAGTYIRSIAHELGQRLGCGAHLAQLRRVRSGSFGIEKALTITELEALGAAGQLAEAFIPAADLLPEFPSERVDALTAGFIRQGRDFRVSPFRVRMGSQFVKAITEDGELLAIGQVRLPNLYHPILVL